MSAQPLFLRHSAEELADLLLPLHAWKPFPQATDRPAWDALQQTPPMARKAAYLSGRAEGICGINTYRYLMKGVSGKIWPPLDAQTYMEFIRTGDRANYEGPYFQRRLNLGVLTMAECLEGEGRFLDEITNGLWAIGSEPTWSVPAHVRRQQAGGQPDAFPDLSVPTVDLFASETAFALAEAIYLLRDRLNAATPGVVPWIEWLIDERVVRAVENFSDDYWWFDGHNNWTPWCCANVLAAAFYTCDDRPRLGRLLVQLFTALQRFYDKYNNDGGCDEGPMYWFVSPGALALALELLHSRSGGKIDFYNDPKIQAMGRYLPAVRLAKNYFVNFADSKLLRDTKRGVTYRFGQRLNNRALQEVALLSARGWHPDGPANPPLGIGHCASDLCQILRELWWIPAEDTPSGAPLPLTTWFPDLQVAVLRSSPDENSGLTVAAKAGHNAENHNHNDVGQFIAMLDGEPAIVDAGIGSYTRLTFSDKRYTLWMTRGSTHNLPVINGVEQTAGKERAARAVCFHDDVQAPSLSLDASSVYPEEARVRAFTRNIQLDRGANAGSGALTVDDRYELDKAGGTLQLRLLTPRQVEELRPGVLRLRADAGRAMLLTFDANLFRLVLGSRTPQEDPDLLHTWPQGLTLIDLCATDIAPAGKYRLRFEPEE